MISHFIPWEISSRAVTSGSFIFPIRLGVYTFSDETVATDDVHTFCIFCPFAVLITGIWNPLRFGMNFHDGVYGITSECEFMQRIIQHLRLIRNAILNPYTL